MDPRSTMPEYKACVVCLVKNARPVCSRLEVEALDWLLSSPPLVLNESMIDLHRDPDAVHISGAKTSVQPVEFQPCSLYTCDQGDDPI